MSTVVDCTAVALNQRKRVLPCFDMVAEPWTGAKLSIARVVMAAAVVIALMALGMQLAETVEHYAKKDLNQSLRLCIPVAKQKCVGFRGSNSNASEADGVTGSWTVTEWVLVDRPSTFDGMQRQVQVHGGKVQHGSDGFAISAEAISAGETTISACEMVGQHGVESL